MITNLKVTGPSKSLDRSRSGDYAVCGTIDGQHNKIIAEFFNQVDHTIFLDSKSNAELFKQAMIAAKLGID